MCMKRRRFCPSCGKTITEKQEFCRVCKPTGGIEFKSVDFLFCERCKRYLSKNKWKVSNGVEDAVIGIVKESTKEPLDKITSKIPNVTMAAGVNVDYKALVLHDEEEYELMGRFLMTICPKCSKDKTTYFEGILQLRNPKAEVEKFIEKMLDEIRWKGIYATSIKEVRGGKDYYITSKSFLRKIGKELKKRFDGDFNESAQLFSRNHQTSKDIYRLNVLFRCK